MSDLSASHRQLLKAMLDYEVRNYLDIAIAERQAEGNVVDQGRLIEIRSYFLERIEELSK